MNFSFKILKRDQQCCSVAVDGFISKENEWSSIPSGLPISKDARQQNLRPALISSSETAIDLINFRISCRCDDDAVEMTSKSAFVRQ